MQYSSSLESIELELWSLHIVMTLKSIGKGMNLLANMLLCDVLSLVTSSFLFFLGFWGSHNHSSYAYIGYRIKHCHML